MGGVQYRMRAIAGPAGVLLALGLGAEAAAAQAGAPARATVQATLTVVQAVDASPPASVSASSRAPELHAGPSGGVVWLQPPTRTAPPSATAPDGHEPAAPLPVVRSRTVLPDGGDGRAAIRYTVAVAL